MATDDDILRDDREAFQRTADAEADNRATGLDDLTFGRLGKQWPDAIAKQRMIDNRPMLTINRMPTMIRHVVNDARQNRPQIKVHPVGSGADQEMAKVFDGLVRSIQYNSRADIAYDTAIECSTSIGWGYLRVDIDYAHDDSFDMDILIKSVPNPFAVYGDPDGVEPDGSDWMSAFVVERLTKETFRRRYKGAAEVDWEGGGYGSLSDPWVNDETIMVAERWKREEVEATILRVQPPTMPGMPPSQAMVISAERFAQAQGAFAAGGYQVIGERKTKSWKVIQRIMTGAEVLETNDWAGKYIPIIPVYGDAVNVDGKLHLRSLIRDARDPQINLNVWRTASTEAVGLAPKVPYVGAVGSFETDNRKWSSANVANYPFIEYDPVPGANPPQRQPFAGPPAGALQEAINASDDIKSVIGIFDAGLGAGGNETSARMVTARQKQSDRGTFHFNDNLNRAIGQAGRIILDLIPSVYPDERVVRITQEDGAQEDVKVNRRQPDGTRMLDLTVGKYDLTIASGPSHQTRREEAAEQMVELLRAFPQGAPAIADLLVKNLDWPGADEIAERLQQMRKMQESGKSGEHQADQHHQMAVEQIKLQALQQQKAIELDATMQLEHKKAELSAQVEAHKQRAQHEQIQAQNQMEAQRASQASVTTMDKAKLEAIVKIVIAQVNATKRPAPSAPAVFPEGMDEDGDRD